MRDFAEKAIWAVPYLVYGGRSVSPWSREQIEAAAVLGEEPNMLAWYIGDDITERHLAGIRSTTEVLRELTPEVPIVADYISSATPEARNTFRRYVDIRCQYAYPIVGDTIQTYREFFDEQRESVGDPLWTWIQCFAWGPYQEELNLGFQGFGPVPDPEQVRLLAFTAVIGGVRGLLYYPGRAFGRLPELAGEVGLVNWETRLFSEHLAAGEHTFRLATSEPSIDATAFRYRGSTVVAAALHRDHYHQWVDDAVVDGLSIDVPWTGDELPEAALVQTPDLVRGTVQRVSDSVVRITLPSFELAGYVFVGSEAEVSDLRHRVGIIPERIAALVVPALASQNKKTNQVLWHAGWDRLRHSMPQLLDATALVTEASEHVHTGRYGDAVAAWRRSLRISRSAVDSLMRAVRGAGDVLRASDLAYAGNPYGLRMLGPLHELPSEDGPWRYVTAWRITGPFTLEHPPGTEPDNDRPAPGFVRAYAPEHMDVSAATFETLEGQTGWRDASTNLAGVLDMRAEFDSTHDVVAYARTAMFAPRDTTVTCGLGVNDAARVFLNGDVVYSHYRGRHHATRELQFDLRLEAGRNELLVKVANLGARWRLSVRLHDPNRFLRLESHQQ